MVAHGEGVELSSGCVSIRDVYIYMYYVGLDVEGLLGVGVSVLLYLRC